MSEAATPQENESSNGDSCPWIQNTSDATFEQDVLERSTEVLVIVDFWAPWCGPCRTLTPLLEKLAKEYDGRFILVKANVDEATTLSAQPKVQVVPTVFAFRDKQPVNAFQGVKTEPELREWFGELLPSDAQLLIEAAKQLVETDADAAEAKFREALTIDDSESDAKIGLAKLLLQADRLDECQELVEDLEAHGLLNSQAEDLGAGLKIKRLANEAGDLDACRAAVEAAADDLEAKLKLAHAQLGAEEYEQAFETCLAIVQKDKQGFGQFAKDVMVLGFQKLGPDSDLVRNYRRQLSSLLF